MKFTDYPVETGTLVKFYDSDCIRTLEVVSVDGKDWFHFIYPETGRISKVLTRTGLIERLNNGKASVLAPARKADNYSIY